MAMLLDEIEGHGWAGIRREARFKTKAIDGFFSFIGCFSKETNNEQGFTAKSHLII